MTAPTTYHLRGADGIEVFTGTITPPPGGGSAGIWQVADYEFDEPNGPSADLVKTFAVPAKAVVMDVNAWAAVGPWTDAVTLNVGDSAHAAGYFDTKVVGTLSPYDPAIGEVGSLSLYTQGTGPPNGYGQVPIGNGGTGVPYPTGDTVTMTVAGIVTGGGGGKLLVRVIYTTPITPV